MLRIATLTMGTLKRPSNKKIIEAFQHGLGFKVHTAESLGVCRQTLDRWLDSDPELKAAVLDQDLRNIEFSENSLYMRIKGFTKETKTTTTRSDGSVDVMIKETYYPPAESSIHFHLARKGRHEGYSPTIDINHNVNTVIAPEERNKRIEILQKKLEK